VIHEFNHLESSHQLSFAVALIDEYNQSQQDRSSQVIGQRPSANPPSQLQGFHQCAETERDKGQNHADGGFAVSSEHPLRHSPIIAKTWLDTAQMTVA